MFSSSLRRVVSIRAGQTLKSKVVLYAGLWMAVSSAPTYAIRCQNESFSYPILVDSARKLMAEQKWDSAAIEFKKALALNPYRGDAWNQLGRCLYRAKRFREAIPAYEKASDLKDGWPAQGLYSAACCYALLGNKKMALAEFENACRHHLRITYLDIARTDQDLLLLRSDPTFRRLVGLPTGPPPARTEGLRSDLQFIVSQLERDNVVPYHHVSQVTFHKEAADIARDVPHLTDKQFLIRVMHLVSLLGSGHTYATQDPAHIPLLPMHFYAFQEGLYITDARPDLAALVGAQVLKFGSTSVEALMAKLNGVMSGDNKLKALWGGPEFLMRNCGVLNGLGVARDADKVLLTLRTVTGKVVTMSVKGTVGPYARLVAPAGWPEAYHTAAPLYLRDRDKDYWLEAVPNSNLLFVQYNHVYSDSNEPMEAFAERISRYVDEHNPAALILDMRWNNGGDASSAEPLIRMLVASKLNKRGKLFIIVGRRTFSAAMVTAIQLERHTNAIFVGERTVTSPNFWGEDNPISLPYSKIIVSLSDVTWANSFGNDDREWLAPEILAPPTIASYLAGVDPALLAIQNYLSKYGNQ